MDRRVTSHAAGAPGAHPKTSGRSTRVRTRRRVEISLSWSSHAVRFLPFSHNSGIHRPRRLRRDGTRIPEIRNSLPAAGPLCGSCPPSPPLAVWSTLPVAASLVVLRLPPYTLPSSKEIIAENLFLRRQLALYQER